MQIRESVWAQQTAGSAWVQLSHHKEPRVRLLNTQETLKEQLTFQTVWTVSVMDAGVSGGSVSPPQLR